MLPLKRSLKTIPIRRGTSPLTIKVPVCCLGPQETLSTQEQLAWGGRSAQRRCLVIRAQAATYSSYCPKPASCGCAPTVVATSHAIKMYFLSLTFARRPLIGGWTRNLGHFISAALLTLRFLSQQLALSSSSPNVFLGCPFQARLAAASVELNI